MARTNNCLRCLRSISFLIWAIAATTFSVAGISLAQSNQNSPLGTNLNTLTFFSPELAFSDIFKQSRVWKSATSSNPNDSRPLDIDENGWVRSLLPGQYAATHMVISIDKGYPGGIYTLLYDGAGEIVLGNDVSEIISSEPGRIVFRVQPSTGGITLQVRSVNPSNYIRNIRVILPGANESELFYRPFLDSIANYRVIRFLGWMIPDGLEEVFEGNWEKRPLPTWATQAPGGSPERFPIFNRGVALEYMIELANQANADPWFTIPHLATDDYIRKFAEMVKQRLAPNRKAYVEWSNEVWNWQFPQTRYADQKAQELGLGSLHEYYARRSIEMFNIWTSVFGNEQARFVRVLAVQSSVPGPAKRTMDYRHEIYGLASENADALAIAPYLIDLHGEETGRTVDQVLDQLPESMDFFLGRAAEQAANASARGLVLIAYEGGQHLVGKFAAVNDAALNQLYDAANRHPRMKDLYLTYLARWRALGGQLFVHYSSMSNYSKWGRWGSLEYMGQPRSTAPKYDALQQFITENPAWWLDGDRTPPSAPVLLE